MVGWPLVAFLWAVSVSLAVLDHGKCLAVEVEAFVKPALTTIIMPNLYGCG